MRRLHNNEGDEYLPEREPILTAHERGRLRELGIVAAIVLGVGAFVIAVLYLAMLVNSHDRDAACADLCVAHEGQMLQANRYGCTCFIDGWPETFPDAD